MKVVIGEVFNGGGFGNICSVKNNDKLVVKYESINLRQPEQFFKEVLIQNEAA